jgi:hypothetical protein
VWIFFVIGGARDDERQRKSLVAWACLTCNPRCVDTRTSDINPAHSGTKLPFSKVSDWPFILVSIVFYRLMEERGDKC